jgi:hypothetical protein
MTVGSTAMSYQPKRIRFASGGSIQNEVADLCTNFGYTIIGTGSITGQGAPLIYTNTGKLVAHDLTIERPDVYPPLSVALEVKGKKLYEKYIPHSSAVDRTGKWTSDLIYLDVHRLEYALEYRHLHPTRPFLFVFKTKKPYEEPDPSALVCATVEMLSGNEVYKDPGTKDEYGNSNPSYLYESRIFLPFLDFLQHGKFDVITNVNLTIPANNNVED